MSGTVKAGVGTTVRVAASPSSTAYLAKVLSIGGPNLSAESVEVTTLDSTGGFKEYVPGIREGGDVNLELYWSAGNAPQDLLQAAVDTDTPLWFYIEWPTSPLEGAAFYANVASYGAATAANEGVKATVGLKISGAVTWGVADFTTLAFSGAATKSGHQVDTGLWQDDAGLWLYSPGVEYGTRVYTGLGFNGVTVARGATIASAKIVVAGTQDYGLNNYPSTPWKAMLAVEDTDSATVFSNSHRPQAQLASGVWATQVSMGSHIPNYTASPAIGPVALEYDVTALVQHIVNRSGWASGNRINFVGHQSAGGIAPTDENIFTLDTTTSPAPIPRLVIYTTV